MSAAKDDPWYVSKHDCIRHGVGSWPDDTVRGCDPPCDDPWQVDAPWPRAGKTFATWAEAFAWADEESRKPQ